MYWKDFCLKRILLIPRKFDKNHPVLKSGSSIWFCETVHALHTFGPSKLESVNSLSLSFLSTSRVKRYLNPAIFSLIGQILFEVFLITFFFSHIVLLKSLRCQTQSTTRARLRLMGQTMQRRWTTRKYFEISPAFCPLEEYFRICHEKISVCSDYVLSKTKHRPKIGIICGSGLGKSIETKNFFLLLNSDPIIGGLAELVTNPDSFPYEEIPGFPQSTVEGKTCRKNKAHSSMDETI